MNKSELKKLDEWCDMILRFTTEIDTKISNMITADKPRTDRYMAEIENRLNLMMEDLDNEIEILQEWLNE